MARALMTVLAFKYFSSGDMYCGFKSSSSAQFPRGTPCMVSSRAHRLNSRGVHLARALLQLTCHNNSD
ncbi:hypothetical protein QE152_g40944 [Popillia japonica]|uniref:Secreted protein n=1 Tax=Popillia japonica TaxID=7064 RepID=A0AAW1HF04_POPJA